MELSQNQPGAFNFSSFLLGLTLLHRHFTIKMSHFTFNFLFPMTIWTSYDRHDFLRVLPPSRPLTRNLPDDAPKRTTSSNNDTSKGPLGL